MGLKGFGTGSDRKMEREEVEVDLGLEVVLCTAGVVVQARGFGCVECPKADAHVGDYALPFLQL
jgi:hypothetical protein